MRLAVFVFAALSFLASPVLDPGMVALAQRIHPPITKPAPTATEGVPGEVWVNIYSNVYHCQGDEYYGKTKDGRYMSESAAAAAGNRPYHGKACH